MTSCGENTPDPAVSFLGGYVGQVLVRDNTASSQVSSDLTIHIIKTSHPDSVMIDLLNRAGLFPNPLLATIHLNKLIIFPQSAPSSGHMLMGQASRTGDSLHLLLTETGSNLSIIYKIKASRLRD